MLIRMDNTDRTEVNLKVWHDTRAGLKLLAVLAGKTMKEALHDLVLAGLSEHPGAKDLQDQVVSKQKE